MTVDKMNVKMTVVKMTVDKIIVGKLTEQIAGSKMTWTK